jgi:hypothetical protein
MTVSLSDVGRNDMLLVRRTGVGLKEPRGSRRHLNHSGHGLQNVPVT